MKLSETAKCVELSLTRELFNKANAYDDVVDFTLGDPDFPTPNYIKAAAHRAIDTNRTRYSANAGLLELRKILSKTIEKETGVKYSPDHEIIVTVGAMQALYLALLCMIDRDDEVIIPAPYWINYDHMVKMCGGKSVIVDSFEKNDFIVSIDDIEKNISEKTTAIIINSPNNPTGTVYNKKTLEGICKLAKKYDFSIIWDECYKTITYDEKFISILENKDITDRLVVINSCSKRFAMTGWRIGYAAAPSCLIQNMTKLQENIVACAPLPSQYAAIAAFSDENGESKILCEGYKKRRNLLVDGINNIQGLSCKMPKGTFYAFVNIKGTGLSDIDFAYKLLDKKHVAVVPGVTYGKCCEGFVRIAYTVNETLIKEGLRRIEEFVNEL